MPDNSSVRLDILCQPWAGPAVALQHPAIAKTRNEGDSNNGLDSKVIIPVSNLPKLSQTKVGCQEESSVIISRLNDKVRGLEELVLRLAEGNDLAWQVFEVGLKKGKWPTYSNVQRLMSWWRGAVRRAEGVLDRELRFPSWEPLTVEEVHALLRVCPTEEEGEHNSD